MKVSLPELIKDWLVANHWDVLEVKGPDDIGGSRIQPKNWGTLFEPPMAYIGASPFVSIDESRVKNIQAADPEFFEKLDSYLTRKYFHLSEWHQEKMNPKKPRKQIWP